MATNNAINQYRPSCFSAYLSASTTDDVTGDGTVFTIPFDTTLYTDGNYNIGTGIYTAPLTGRYLITGVVMYNNIGAHPDVQVIINNNGMLYSAWLINGTNAASGTQLRLPFSQLISMFATNTTKISVVVTGGTKTVGIVGSGAPYSSWLSCTLVV
jgi:hypothetical protein